MRLLLLLTASVMLGQQEPVIRLDVRQVLVPVIVTDKKGRHVAGLHASDFKILEDGIEQKIAAFSSETAGSTDDIEALSKPAAPATGARRTFVICVDTLHSAPANAVHVREALEILFEKEKPSDAQYVLMGIGRQIQMFQTAAANPLEVLLKVRGPAFLNAMGGMDAFALAADIQNLRGRMDEFCRRCACGTRGGMRNCDSEIDNLKQSVDAEAERWVVSTNALVEQFGSVVEELARIPTGRTLILISEGFDVNAKRQFYRTVSDYLPGRPQFRTDDSQIGAAPLRDALKVAAERNITIYCIDSRGSATPSLVSTGPMDAGASAGAGGGYSMLGTNRSQTSMVPSVRSGTLQTQSATAANPFTGEQSASMSELARATGGAYFHDSGDMLKQLRGALAEGREYYVLAYISTNPAQDGNLRAIKVETANRNLNLRAKAGYWAGASAQ